MRSRPSIGQPVWANARLERVLLFGTDQRITSGPAATAAASRWRQASKRKQAVYMAAPERFAKTSDSSCTAGAVHTWPLATGRQVAVAVAFGWKADMARVAGVGRSRPGADIASASQAIISHFASSGLGRGTA